MSANRNQKLSATHQRDLARIDQYIQLFNKAVASHEKENPDWQTHSLLWVLENAFGVLRRELSERKRVHWNSPFSAFQYPVAWDWAQWREDKVQFAIQYGHLTSKNTHRRKDAIRALAQMMVRQQLYTTLLDLTHNVASCKYGSYQRPMIPEVLAEEVRQLKGRRRQTEALESLFFPFSIGAAEVEMPENLKHGQTIPRKFAEQLQRATNAIDIPEMVFFGTSDGHPIEIRVIFQVFPLTIEERLKRAYFPTTIGLVLQSAEPLQDHDRASPRWIDPERWNEKEREQFWTELLKAVRHQHEFLKQPPKTRVNQEVAKVTAKLEIEMVATSPEAVQRSADRVLDALRQGGFLTAYKIKFPSAPPPVDTAKAAMAILKKMEHAKTAAAKGQTLEDLLTALLCAVPGFEVTNRVRTATEEIDLRVLNSHGDPRWRSEAVLLFECKN